MKRTKRIIAIALLIFGAGGFIAATQSKGKNRIQEMSGKSDLTLTMEVAPPHTYHVSFWIVAEKGESQPGFATAEGALQIRLGGETLTSETLVAVSSDAKGGLKRATHGIETDIAPKAPGILSITGGLREGDQWTLEVYRDLGAGANLAPGLFLLVGIVGLILFLRSRAA